MWSNLYFLLQLLLSVSVRSMPLLQDHKYILIQSLLQCLMFCFHMYIFNSGMDLKLYTYIKIISSSPYVSMLSTMICYFKHVLSSIPRWVCLELYVLIVYPCTSNTPSNLLYLHNIFPYNRAGLSAYIHNKSQCPAQNIPLRTQSSL